ncbi:hypothetical protein M5K25_008003 [Dendrobium thyrsiflorum]|uniref:FAD-binding PCMH-type domain-containing protein n=1 Tax=Dendrobium thyrsiflorum TaxID=117978 RepID=A0ABD0V7J1_DENTH
MAMRSLFPLHPISTAAGAAASDRLLLLPPLPTPDLSESSTDIDVGNRKLLRDLSTFGIGGPCSFFIEATRPAHLISAAHLARSRSLPLLILGRGSNCLFSDRGFDGLVVLNRSSIHETVEVVGPGRVRVGSGYPFNRLGVRTAVEGWGGLEFAGGIPGTVGGAAFMNAGANGQETAEVVESVEVVNREGGVRALGKEDLRFGYRWSSLQEMDDLAAILTVTFRLRPAPAARNRQREFLERVCVQVTKDCLYPDSIPITILGEPFTLKIQYEWKHIPCEHCASIVHPSDLCPSQPQPANNTTQPNSRGRSTSRKPHRSYTRPLNHKNNQFPPNKQSAPAPSNIPNSAPSTSQALTTPVTVNILSPVIEIPPSTSMTDNPQKPIPNLNSPTEASAVAT